MAEWWSLDETKVRRKPLKSYEDLFTAGLLEDQLEDINSELYPTLPATVKLLDATTVYFSFEH